MFPFLWQVFAVILCQVEIFRMMFNHSMVASPRVKKFTFTFTHTSKLKKAVAEGFFIVVCNFALVVTQFSQRHRNKYHLKSHLRIWQRTVNFSRLIYLLRQNIFYKIWSAQNIIVSIEASTKIVFIFTGILSLQLYGLIQYSIDNLNHLIQSFPKLKG